jgi:hypothetical protein
VELLLPATSHGKSACKAIEGTVVRLGRKASPQNPYEEQIMIPRQLYEWVVVKFPSATFDYFTVANHSKRTNAPEQRFKQVQTLQGTQRIHCDNSVQKPSPGKIAYKNKCVQHHTHIHLQDEVEVEDTRKLQDSESDRKLWLAYVTGE